MKGVKVVGSRRRRAPHDCTFGYSFQDLLQPIEAPLRDLCWALQGTQVFVAEADGVALPDEDALEAMFDLAPGLPAPREPEVALWDVAWLKPGCLERLAPLIVGDWTDIVGVLHPPAWSRASVRPDDNSWLEQNASVYFACIDAAFWEVYAQDERILERLALAFPASEGRVLKDKDY